MYIKYGILLRSWVQVPKTLASSLVKTIFYNFRTKYERYQTDQCATEKIILTKFKSRIIIFTYFHFFIKNIYLNFDVKCFLFQLLYLFFDGGIRTNFDIILFGKNGISTNLIKTKCSYADLFNSLLFLFFSVQNSWPERSAMQSSFLPSLTAQTPKSNQATP